MKIFFIFLGVCTALLAVTGADFLDDDDLDDLDPSAGSSMVDLMSRGAPPAKRKCPKGLTRVQRCEPTCTEKAFGKAKEQAKSCTKKTGQKCEQDVYPKCCVKGNYCNKKKKGTCFKCRTANQKLKCSIGRGCCAGLKCSDDKCVGVGKGEDCRKKPKNYVCNSGLYCSDINGGTCLDCLEAGGDCSKNTQYACCAKKGLSCKDGKCVKDVLNKGGKCNEDNNAAVCPNSTFCTRSSNGVCRKCLTLGDTCTGYPSNACCDMDGMECGKKSGKCERAKIPLSESCNVEGNVGVCENKLFCNEDKDGICVTCGDEGDECTGFDDDYCCAKSGLSCKEEGEGSFCRANVLDYLDYCNRPGDGSKCQKDLFCSKRTNGECFCCRDFFDKCGEFPDDTGCCARNGLECKQTDDDNPDCRVCVPKELEEGDSCNTKETGVAYCGDDLYCNKKSKGKCAECVGEASDCTSDDMCCLGDDYLTCKDGKCAKSG